MDKVYGLVRYMESLKEELGVEVILKDFIGFLHIEPNFFEILQAFYIHQCTYCMQIKMNCRLWTECLITKEKLRKRLERNGESFYGVCHAGVGEFVEPIIYRDEKTKKSVVIGAVTLGGYLEKNFLDSITSDEKPQRKYQHLNENREMLRQYYQESFKCKKVEMDKVKSKLLVIADYLLLLYEQQIKKILKIGKDEGVIEKDTLNRNYIVANSIAFIKKHYKEEIRLEDIAKFCHCSKSYISHQFRQTTGKTLKGFINEQRLLEAAKLLKEKDMRISEIGILMGYNDSNYFSAVFKKYFGVSPRVYQGRCD